MPYVATWSTKVIHQEIKNACIESLYKIKDNRSSIMRQSTLDLPVVHSWKDAGKTLGAAAYISPSQTKKARVAASKVGLA